MEANMMSRKVKKRTHKKLDEFTDSDSTKKIFSSDDGTIRISRS